MLEHKEYATRYEQLHSTDFRGVLRHITLSTLGTSYKVTGGMASALSRNRVQFLYLHHVFEDEEDSFRRLLRTLSLGHRFVSYSEAVGRVLSGDIDGPYVAVSFDDGLKNCMRAARIMGEFGVRACFFLCPSIIGETDYHKVKKFCSQRLYIPPMEFLSWDDVEALLEAGHEVGSHTMTHPNLAQLSVQQMQSEIAESFEVLTKRIGDIEHFSWPYGRFFNFSPAAAKTVFDTGFKSCASAEKGCHVINSEKQETDLCVRRNHIIAGWPINHVLYFMARSSRTASIRYDQWPPGWVRSIRGGT
jgi:peptidoglycan/xylan/chitin deacetylase (PgdA/CDA1 family)